jgi:uncharacterized OsmC-like protein
MSETTRKLSFQVTSRRTGAHGSVARCKGAELQLDTDLAGRTDAFNPAELLLAALSACMIKGIERVAPILKFQWRGVEVRVHGVRQDVPPRLESIDYEIQVDSDESEQRLALVQVFVRLLGWVLMSVARGCRLAGVLRRAG